MSELVNRYGELVDRLGHGDEEGLSWAGSSGFIDSLERMPGDASTRRYYRILAGGASYILLVREPFTEEGASNSFLSVRSHLEHSGVDVPKVLAWDADRGSILLEDLGDVTLLRQLQGVSDTDIERSMYERSIDALVRLQTQASPREGAVVPPLEGFRLRFDLEKLMWEVNFAIEHFYKLHLGREIQPNDLKIMVDGFTSICTALDRQPLVFTHRDYHSRNIMVTPGDAASGDRFVMIDFQDARMGPAQYDLASLLKDSYYQLDEAQIERLIDYYIARYEAASGEVLDRAEFRRIFDLMSVQRNFKAIGSFASFQNRRGIATYLKYIGNTFENIRRALLKYPEYSALREVLFHYYYF